MEAGYSVGTRTIVDVLDATTTQLQPLSKIWQRARYNYLINQLNIKSALGTLNEQDSLALNNALSKPVSTNSGKTLPRKRRNRMLLLMVMRPIARHPSFSKHPHALPPVTVITLSVTDDDDGASAPSEH